MEQKIWAVLVTNTERSCKKTAFVKMKKLYMGGCTWNHIPSDCKKLNSFCYICKEASPHADVTAGEMVSYSKNTIQLTKMFQGMLYNIMYKVDVLRGSSIECTGRLLVINTSMDKYKTNVEIHKLEISQINTLLWRSQTAIFYLF